MATIEKRVTKKGVQTFRVRVRLDDYPYESLTFCNRTDAEFWGRERERFLKVGTRFDSIAASQQTFAQMIDRYKLEVLPTRFDKPKYTKQYAMQLDWWKNELGSYTLANIGPSRIAETRRKFGIRHATANRYMACLSHVYYVAICEWEWLKYSPMAKIRRLPERSARTRCLNESQMIQLLDLAQQSYAPEIYLLIIMALSTGARKGELFSLRKVDIDFTFKRATFRDTKNGHDRSVPITTYVQDLLRDQLQRTTDKQLLFPPIMLRHLDRAFRTMIDKLEIEDFRFHDLRHTAASFLAMSGATFVEIGSILGHRTLRSTMRYTHLFDTHTADVVQRMNDRIFKNTTITG